MKHIMKYLAVFSIASLALMGCKDKIGDSCHRDMDCSPNGDRTCDPNQPGGYCLIITCEPDECPDEAVCAEFITPSPDFDVDSDSDTDTDTDSEYNSDTSEALYSQLASSRARTYCLKKCKKDKDCRGKYHCALDTELEEELNGMIIDSKYEGLGICVPDK